MSTIISLVLIHTKACYIFFSFTDPVPNQANMLTEVLVLLISLLLVYIFKWVRSSRGLPPGPARYPLVGSLPSLYSMMGKRLGGIHKTVTKMAKAYGDVFTIYFPGFPVVVINSIETARQALVTQKDDLSGKPSLFSLQFLTLGGRGAFSGFSAKLIVMRTVFHSAMQMYRPLLGGKILEESAQKLQKLSGAFRFDGGPCFLSITVIYIVPSSSIPITLKS